MQPGTPEWSALGSTQARIAALQVPETLLKTMSTAGLVETCVNYPFLSMTSYDTYSDALNTLIRIFNGLKELAQWSDAGSMLLSKYSTIDPETAYQHWQRDHRGNLPHDQLLLIETFLVRDEILAGIPLPARQKLLQESLRVFRAKTDSINYRHQATVPVVLMAKTLASLDYAPFRRQILEIPTQSKQYHDLLQSGGMSKTYSTELLNEIIHNAEDYLTTITREGGQP